MSGAPQVAMRIASQIWQIFFASQTLQIFCLALRKKAQYVVVIPEINTHSFSFKWALTLGTLCSLDSCNDFMELVMFIIGGIFDVISCVWTFHFACLIGF
jgi:hypothetical protein